MARSLACWHQLTGWTVRVLVSEVVDGSLAVDDPAGALLQRREALRPGPWTWLRQVHGERVVLVDGPGDGVGSEADASVTVRSDTVLSIQVADCAPVVLAAPGGLAVVHAGWRGLREGVIERASECLAKAAPGPQAAVVGPCIRACCYEFGSADLDALCARFGDGVRALTSRGRPAFDVPAAVRIVLERCGVSSIEFDGVCTGCDDRHWSHRVDGSDRRQTLVAWMEAS